MSVNLSPLGGAGAQFFTNDGVPLTGGLLYTYLAGTSTPATTYTSGSGVTALANPIILDAAGRVPTGEIWLSDGINYKFVLKDSTDVLIATWDGLSGINSNFIAYTAQEETVTATAGQTVFNLSIAYVPATNNLAVFVNGSNQVVSVNYTETDENTVTFLTGLNVGDVVKFSTASPVATNAVDAANVSYTPPGGTNAVVTNVQAKLRQTVSVVDFGAIGDGVTDDTDAIQDAILSAALGDSSATITFPTATYKVEGTIYVPSNIELDLCQSTLVGTGSTISDNIMFNTGYLSGGAIISNFGTPEANRVINTKIYNGTIKECNIGFNLQNFNEGCEVSNIYFLDCGQNIYAFRCFYGSFEKIHSRASVTLFADTRAAFQFVSYVNVQKIDSIFCVNRKLAFFLNGASGEGVDGTTMTNCGAEEGTDGIVCLYSLRPLTIQGCYFEKLTGIAIDVSNASAQYLSVQGCWFGECATGFKASTWSAGTFYADNTWVDSSGVGTFVNITSNIAAFGTVQIPTQYSGDNVTPAIPAKYILGSAVKVEFPIIIYDSGTGLPKIRQNYTGGLIDLPYSGNAGSAPGGIAYCTTSSSGGTSFSVYVDTKINAGDYVCGVFNLYLQDNVGTYTLYGRFYGTALVVLDQASAKTVTVSNNAGFIRLTISTFSHPTGAFSASGIVRHL